MFVAPDSPYLANNDAGFRLGSRTTSQPDDAPAKKKARALLGEEVDAIAKLQHKLYAEDKWAVLLVFQALDAAGKDGTIRAVLSGVNPAGVSVASFKSPSSEELDHDYLWRTNIALPRRGQIGVFNRSWYEETLVVRVHPEYLGGQRLPFRAPGDAFWQERFESIAAQEQHLARNGVAILKFWLNVSKEEQASRLLRRIDDPRRNWKFSSQDVKEREHWDDYQAAASEMIGQTHRPWAPWYVLPADDKPWMRLSVGRLLRATLEQLDPKYPVLGDKERAQLGAMRAKLVPKGGG